MSDFPPPATRFHEDPGLQPERTVLSWGRTMMALCTAAALHLRWLPTHGPFVLSLLTVALLVALGIYATQRMRYRRSAVGLQGEGLAPDVVAVFVTAGACVVLGALGIATVLRF